MKRYLRNVLLGSIYNVGLSAAYAQDIVVDLGNFPAQLCVFPQSVPSPNISNDYGQHVVRVTAKVFLIPVNPITVRETRACVQRAQAELAESKSFTNMQLFREAFQDYISTCTRRANVGIQSVKALLTTDSSCRRNG
jgi:hypothetical protein